MIFVKLYQYFGVVGILSIVAWIMGAGLLIRYARRERFKAHYTLVLGIAIVAHVLGRLNSDQVSGIRVDERARLEAIQEERLRLREASDGPGKVRVRFAEDSASDRLDEAGVSKEDLQQLAGEAEANIAPEGLSTPASAGAEEKPEEPAMATQDPELAPAGGEEPAYRRAGKQSREKGKQVALPAIGSASEAVTPMADNTFRIMPEPDVTAANRLDRWNLLAIALLLWAASIAFVWDYLLRLNTTFHWRYPLPITGHWLDSVFPKARSVLVLQPKEGVLRSYLEGIVRKGETFLYLGDKSLWRVATLPRLPFVTWILWAFRKTRAGGRRVLGWTPRFVRRTFVGTGKGIYWLFWGIGYVFKKAGRAIAFPFRFIPTGKWGAALRRGSVRGWTWVRERCADLRYLPIASWLGLPLQRIAYGTPGVPSGSDFVFDAVWFNRYCVEVGDKAAAERLTQDIVPYLDRRTLTRAAARRTVNVVWDFATRPDEATIKKLTPLFKETNFKFLVSVPEKTPEAVADCFEEVYFDELPLRASHDFTSDLSSVVKTSAEPPPAVEKAAEADKVPKASEATPLVTESTSLVAPPPPPAAVESTAEMAAASALKEAEAKAAEAAREASVRAEADRQRREAEELSRREAAAKLQREELERREQEKRAAAQAAASQPPPPVPAGSGFVFTCPRCSQTLAAEPSWVGQQVTCPLCAAVLVVPSPEVGGAPPPTPAPADAEAERVAKAQAAERERIEDGRKRQEAETLARKTAEEQALRERMAQETQARADELARREAEAQAALLKAEQEIAGKTQPQTPAGGFAFACPRCNQTLSAEQNWIGMEVACPLCGASIVVPKPVTQSGTAQPPAGEGGAPGSFKFACPNCHQQLSAQTDWSGMQVTCPQCNQAMVVPAAPVAT